MQYTNPIEFPSVLSITVLSFFSRLAHPQPQLGGATHNLQCDHQTLISVLFSLVRMTDEECNFHSAKSRGKSSIKKKNKKKQLLHEKEAVDRRFVMEGNPKFNDAITNSKKKGLLVGTVKVEDKQEDQLEFKGGNLLEEKDEVNSLKSNDEMPTEHKLLLNKKEVEENSKSDDDASENEGENLSVEVGKGKIKEEVNGESHLDEEEQMVKRYKEYSEANAKIAADLQKEKKKKRVLERAAKGGMRGICYLSRIPPKMDPDGLRVILSQYGEIDRIYLVSQNPASQVYRSRAGKYGKQKFSEGWVEFTDKKVAKRVANMLNGEQIGGRKRSQFYYDMWNIKYLSKFKWDDLTAEIVEKNAIREQKLDLEISAAKRERDFYLKKVDKSRALSAIEERLQKKLKVQQELGVNSDLPVSQQAAKVIRHFPQKQPVANNAGQTKPRLSKDTLAGVFADS
nr:pre-rRNA-processing protein ESF2 isoform X1 [Quercus suber]POF10461.1 pre-rrna-processing protein esf2 [Quercus suber]